MKASPSKRALKRHEKACEQGESGYIDPDSGLFVLTSVYLLDRGHCCGKGCRHCPWPRSEQIQAGRSDDLPAWPWEGSGPAP